jgi:ABC-type Zn uptake system ZnuABC Zn-binding protein ZnuA
VGRTAAGSPCPVAVPGRPFPDSDADADADAGRLHDVELVIARNPDPDSTLPYLLRLPIADGLVFRVKGTWPRTSALYCHPVPVTDWPAEPEVVERVPLRACTRRGASIDVVADRGREQRSQIVFTTARGREMVFWQSPRTRKQARPDVRVPTARAAGIDELEIVVDAHERYPYAFAGQRARTVQRALPCGDYGITVGGRLVASVERKSLDDLVSSLSSGRLRFALGELAALPRAAVVVEDRYSKVFAQTRVRPAQVADGLAELQVRWESVPIVFCENRKLAEEWTLPLPRRRPGVGRGRAAGARPDRHRRARRRRRPCGARPVRRRGAGVGQGERAGRPRPWSSAPGGAPGLARRPPRLTPPRGVCPPTGRTNSCDLMAIAFDVVVKNLRPLVLLGLLLAALPSCGGGGTRGGDAAGGSRGALRVVTTVAPLTSIVANIVGRAGTVTGLVPEGTNSHTFEPPPSAARDMADADVVFLNGLKLEDPTRSLAAKAGARIVELGTLALPEAEHIYDFSFPREGGKPNPHLWTSPVMVKRYAEIVRDTLSEIDPGNAASYRSNAAAYRARVDALDAALRTASATLPPERRRLLTYHDAYAYFAREYGWTVIGAIQVSDFEDPTPREVARLIDQVRAEKVPAIFGSEVFPSPVLERIGKEAGVRYVDELRDDDLPGQPGSPEHTLLALLRFDYVTIITSLGGDASALERVDVTDTVDDDARYPQ